MIMINNNNNNNTTKLIAVCSTKAEFDKFQFKQRQIPLLIDDSYPKVTSYFFFSNLKWIFLFNKKK